MQPALPHGPPRRPANPLRPLAIVVLVGATACGGGGGGGGGGSGLPVGSELEKPGGGTFFLDPHQGGAASRIHLVEAFWGRLVDVHDVDASGVARATPVYRDLVVSENVISDGFDYSLEINAVTQTSRLVVRRTRGEPDDGSGTFEDLLRAAREPLPAVIPRDDSSTTPGPFSVLPRNAVLVLRFDDVLDDGAPAATGLGETVRVLTGYPPSTPFEARVVFDPNHGAVVGGAFHSTRLLVDMTLSETEAASLPYPASLNALGLPASNPESGRPSASIRIPTRVDFGSGQFSVLRSLGGAPLASTGNGPVDETSPTVDVVRAFRSGNDADLNNGFLLDPFTPRIVGSWTASVTAAAEGGGADLFLLDLRFDTPCRKAPGAGDVVLSGQRFLEVTDDAAPPDATGLVRGVRVRVLGSGVAVSPPALLGSASFLSPHDPALPVDPGCWVTLLPAAGRPPTEDVSTDARVLVRFSEPMDPASVRPFDTLRMIRGIAGTQPLPRNLVVGGVVDSPDLTEFTFTPTLPLATGGSGVYVLELIDGPRGITDLAGNALENGLPLVELRLDPGEPSVESGGVVMRFTGADELEPFGHDDFRGQALLDADREILVPRPTTFSSRPVDRTVPTVMNMLRFPPGLQTPLSPLGSKMQSVWRYVDMGWQVRDESKFNMDVIGMAWSPVGGLVVADYYPEFEIRLAHSRKLPDEATNNGPSHPDSGLGVGGGASCISIPGAVTFADNILVDPRSPQKVVHPRFLGYRVDPADLFVSGGGTFLMPYPLNRNVAEPVTYTWRDTAVLAKDGTSSAGIPMDIEVGPPLFLDTGMGSVAQPGLVPSIGLPLLWEIRCYPSSSGLGLNAHDVSIAVSGFCVPNFRVFSTGGVDQTGTAISKNPDLEEFPSGGFNPSSTPPGLPTKLDSDNTFYIGQLDLVVRVSRAHTMWLDTGLLSPRFEPPVVEPAPEEQPAGTRILFDYRGADAFSGVGLEPFDARALDFYGDLPPGTVGFHASDGSWASAVQDVAGSRFVQVRISFVNDIASGANPVLDSFALSWRVP